MDISFSSVGEDGAYQLAQAHCLGQKHRVRMSKLAIRQAVGILRRLQSLELLLGGVRTLPGVMERGDCSLGAGLGRTGCEKLAKAL